MSVVETIKETFRPERLGSSDCLEDVVIELNDAISGMYDNSPIANNGIKSQYSAKGQVVYTVGKLVSLVSPEKSKEILFNVEKDELLGFSYGMMAKLEGEKKQVRDKSRAAAREYSRVVKEQTQAELEGVRCKLECDKREKMVAQANVELERLETERQQALKQGNECAVDIAGNIAELQFNVLQWQEERCLIADKLMMQYANRYDNAKIAAGNTLALKHMYDSMSNIMEGELIFLRGVVDSYANVACPVQVRQDLAQFNRLVEIKSRVRGALECYTPALVSADSSISAGFSGKLKEFNRLFEAEKSIVDEKCRKAVKFAESMHEGYKVGA